MKLNLTKPLIKYLVIVSSAFMAFLLIYTYVKLTNDRVYELAREQVAGNDVKPESTKEALITERVPAQSLPSTNGMQSDIVRPPARSLSAYRTETNGVENKASGKIWIAGKNAITCMRELNTNVINNDVVKCTHDHYAKPN